jgi:hypothetical protein
MAVWNIPLDDVSEVGNFRFTVELEGSVYEFVFHWNSRDGFWYFDLLDDQGQYIKAGAKAIVNWPVLRLQPTRSGPPGELMFVDTRTTPEDPTREGLGVTSLLTYIDSTEISDG